MYEQVSETLIGKKYFRGKIRTLKSKKPTELTLGERLTLLRVESGFRNQEEVGNLLSLSKSAINNYENDNAKPDYEVLKRIAACFNVSYDYLFGVSDSTAREHHDNVNALGIS